MGESTPRTTGTGSLADENTTSSEEAIFKFFAPELNHIFRGGTSVNDQVLCMKLLHADGIAACYYL